MGVDIRVGDVAEELGAGSFLHAFFSTISHRLEPGGWGSRFPSLMKHLYNGRLSAQQAGTVVHELQQVREELRGFPQHQIVWDIEDLSARPPWGNNVADSKTDLSNFFVTSAGRDLIDTLLESLQASRDNGQDVTIE